MNFVILATPRTRSNLLCNLIAKTHRAGMPSEFDPNLSDVASFLERCTRNNVGGIKVLPEKGLNALDEFMEHTQFRFDRYIFLRHPDVIWQSISWLRVEQEGSAYEIKYDKTGKLSRQTTELADINLSELYDLIQLRMREYRMWEAFFRKYDIKPLEIWYHELDNPTAQYHTLKKVFAFLGIFKWFTLPPYEVSYRQSDAWNEQQYQRVLEDLK